MENQELTREEKIELLKQQKNIFTEKIEEAEQRLQIVEDNKTSSQANLKFAERTTEDIQYNKKIFDRRLSFINDALTAANMGEENKFEALWNTCMLTDQAETVEKMKETLSIFFAMQEKDAFRETKNVACKSIDKIIAYTKNSFEMGLQDPETLKKFGGQESLKTFMTFSLKGWENAKKDLEKTSAEMEAFFEENKDTSDTEWIKKALPFLQKFAWKTYEAVVSGVASGAMTGSLEGMASSMLGLAAGSLSSAAGSEITLNTQQFLEKNFRKDQNKNS